MKHRISVRCCVEVSSGTLARMSGRRRSKTEIEVLLSEIAKRVRAARLAANLTQEKVASDAEIDYKRYQKIEAGDVNLTVKTLLRISKALGVSFWQLLQEPPEDG